MSDKETKDISNNVFGKELNNRGFKLYVDEMVICEKWQSCDILILYVGRDATILDYQNGRFYSASSNSEVLEILNDISRGDL